MTRDEFRDPNRAEEEVERIRRSFGNLQRLVSDLRNLIDSLDRTDASPLAVSRLAAAIREHVIQRLPNAEIACLFPDYQNLAFCLQSLAGLLSNVESDARTDAIGGRLDWAKNFGSCIPSHLVTIGGYAHAATNHPAIKAWMPALIAAAETGGIEWTAEGEPLVRSTANSQPPKRRRGRPKRPPEKVATVLRQLLDGKTQDQVALELGYGSRSTISKIKSSVPRDSVK